MKALIPAAGLGNRLKPWTKAVPKELLMVGDKAIIEHVIDALKLAGIEDIIIVVGWKKHALLDYLGDGERLGVNITYAVQEERTGLAKAVEKGERIVGDERFFVALGDNFFEPKEIVKELIEFHEKKGGIASLALMPVENPERHGIAKLEGDLIVDLVEKPKREEAFSNIGAIGLYVFERNIFDGIKEIKPGLNGEYQLTDAIKILIEKGKVYGKVFDGIHIDVGTLEDLKRANEYYYKMK